jgi:hypothetical protein
MIKAYTIAAERRSSVLPNVPTSMEAGLSEFQIPDKASRGQQPLAALVKSEIARWEIFPCEQQTPQALGEHRGPKSESGGQSSRRLASNRSEPPDEDRLFRLGLNNRHPPVQFQ